MKAARRLGSANLSSALSTSRQEFVCQSCRSKIRNQAKRTRTPSREFSTSRARPLRFPSLASLSRKKREDDADSAHLSTVRAKYGSVDDSEYKPASTWDGLEWIGSQSWREQQESIAIDEESMPKLDVHGPPDVADALRQALAEESIKTRSRNSGIDGLAQAQGSERSDGEDWSGVSLQDQSLRFRVIKRISQLTGLLVPDQVVNSSTNAQQLFQALQELQQPPPSKLADILAADSRLQALGNVTIHAKRLPWYHKDQQVGRWKVLERELDERGLLREQDRSELQRH